MVAQGGQEHSALQETFLQASAEKGGEMLVRSSPNAETGA
jgi:hypothetical protein